MLVQRSGGLYYPPLCEENAVGEINHEINRHYTKQNTRYEDPETNNDAFHLLTGAHYHLWTDSAGTGAAQTQDFGALVRRVSIDLKELMFDRAVLLSILDALVVSS